MCLKIAGLERINAGIHQMRTLRALGRFFLKLGDPSVAVGNHHAVLIDFLGFDEPDRRERILLAVKAYERFQILRRSRQSQPTTTKGSVK